MIEQLFFSLLAKQHHKSIVPFYDLDRGKIDDFIRFDHIPFERNYMHCLGEFKNWASLGKQIELRLCIDYPEVYKRVINLLDLPSISLGSAYSVFKSNNHYFFSCKDRNDVLNLPFTLSPHVKIEEENGNYLLYQDEGDPLHLQGWNKFLIYFYETILTGKELINQINQSKLKDLFTQADITDNILALITQNAILHHNLIVYC